MNIFNQSLCHSIKSKNCLTEQCTNKPLINQTLCGKHINAKNIIYFTDYNIQNLNDTLLNNTLLNDTLLNNTLFNDTLLNDTLLNDTLLNNTLFNDTSHNHTNILEKNKLEENKINKENKIEQSINNVTNKIEEKTEKTEKNDIKIIYSKEELFDIIQKNKNISVYSLRKSIKNCYLKDFINTKLTKCNLIKEIKVNIEKERFYTNNIYYIILIQKIYRKWSNNKRAICFNDTDILTFDSIYDIPNKYFYVFNDKVTNKKYGYDIRTLIEIIYSDYPSCPYTFRSFTDEEKNRIYKYKNYLEMKGIELNIEKRVMTEQEEIDMKIKDIFYKINMLDNYTNPLWFKNLNLQQLINLYILMEDIWCYRTSMPMDAKRNIIYNGIAFNVPLYIIKSQKSLIKMQHVILDEFNRFITEGINRDERKLGAILILSGLVEISVEAAEALPHLIQI